ncbi:hypothetical protein CHS0354_042452 [Potamilus streckersoni]|uniref:Uncharacterized protein n=1 Tax=Potamilus streckersoni TaxID=2493646 RepID=A0AAE0VR94_9BIVA|nr:hypothetical protein CHS0354_042452 [Potamilus streckersoni]
MKSMSSAKQLKTKIDSLQVQNARLVAETAELMAVIRGQLVFGIPPERRASLGRGADLTGSETTSAKGEAGSATEREMGYRNRPDRVQKFDAKYEMTSPDNVVVVNLVDKFWQMLKKHLVPGDNNSMAIRCMAIRFKTELQYSANDIAQRPIPFTATVVSMPDSRSSAYFTIRLFDVNWVELPGLQMAFHRSMLLQLLIEKSIVPIIKQSAVRRNAIVMPVILFADDILDDNAMHI